MRFMRRLCRLLSTGQLASPFMKEIHSTARDRTPHVHFTASRLARRCDSTEPHSDHEGASNYYIASARVGHPDIMWNAGNVENQIKGYT